MKHQTEQNKISSEPKKNTHKNMTIYFFSEQFALVGIFRMRFMVKYSKSESQSQIKWNASNWFDRFKLNGHLKDAKWWVTRILLRIKIGIAICCRKVHINFFSSPDFITFDFHLISLKTQQLKCLRLINFWPFSKAHITHTPAPSFPV